MAIELVQDNQHVLSTGTIKSDPVFNSEGKELGTIKEIMIDTKKGCVEYAVLSFGGVLGIGEKYFAVPWEAFEIDFDNQRVILDIEKYKLTEARGFDKNNWPTQIKKTKSK